MSQDFTDDSYAGTHIGQTDLQNMENNLLVLKSSFSGTSAPSNPVAGLGWFDTGKDVLKVRDATNSSYYGLMHGDVNQKLWVYRNSAMSGWVVDSSVSDRVLAFKGGTTYTTGGAGAGSWTVSGLTVDNHNHQWYDYVNLSSAARSYNSDGSARSLSNSEMSAAQFMTSAVGITAKFGAANDLWTAKVAPSVSSTAAWRPLASVGTLQYLNI